ncbi:PQQ-binding-like beta-propeller repeat protein [Streptomyces sp. P9(2023)]|uniref:serine/threonine-protein kinase n=1 Tax=Streptomyces sp. P9(2023) TaxID=3064394 RepID=UPI0028F45985|nr:PQQ-binding-like beta-propeller repeat protein [Streptomyces sp. P9(2023)]MDT9689663.1 PQQ-binding-like beta-propeller repeat protein [Streptomyces sp. P9(2023)]
MPPLRRPGADREAEEPEYAGDYRLQANLGSGGMGVVHLATSASGLRLAVKVVHGQYAEDPEFRARFRQEVAAARRVSGAFTAPVVDADPDAVRPWMATLYVPGPTLADQVKRNGPLSPAELRRLTAGLAEALRDIHRAGVVHRDLKPSNVLLTDTGPKVIDFGISRPVDSDLRTETGKLIGSPPFMAPEQFQRPREVGPAADVFALGSVLVHAATGHGPFDSDSPYIVAYQVVHDEPDLTGLPDALAPLVARCLAKEAAERPTPDEIMSALQPPSYEAAAFIPAQRRPPTLPGPLPGALPGASPAAAAASAAWDADTPVRAPVPRARGRRRLRPSVVAVAVLAVLAAGGAFVALRTDAGDATGPRSHPAGGAAAAFEGWETVLGESGTPACVSAADALYCSAPGVALARLDPASGRVLWSRPGADGARVSAPVAFGGLVGAVADDGTLRAFGADRGAPVWDTGTAARQEGANPAGDTLLYPTSTSAVRGVDGATGKQRWRHPLPGFTAPRFGPYDEASGLVPVFETTGGASRTTLAALRPETGEIVRRQRLAGDLVPVGAGANGVVLLRSSNADSQTDAVVRYDPADGSVRRIALPYPLDDPRIAVLGDTVHLLDSAGRLTALDTAAAPAGRVLWELETAAGNVSAPVLGPGGRLYFSVADGRLLAVDTERGALLGQTGPRLRDGRLEYATTVPAPVVAGDTVFGTAPDGSVFAVDGRDPAGW